MDFNLSNHSLKLDFNLDEDDEIELEYVGSKM